MNNTGKHVRFYVIGFSIFADMTSQNYPSPVREQLIATRYLPPGIDRNSKFKKITLGSGKSLI